MSKYVPSTEGTIEVVCEDMMCFRVDAITLEPLSCSYYEPAARNDPRGPQMAYGAWLKTRPWNKRYAD